MLTTTTREDAERIAATRNIGVAEGPLTHIVVDGPGDGEYSVMTFADAEDAGFVSLCDGCRDGTPHGHMCDDSCDGCYRLRGVVGGCVCEDDDAPVTLRAMRMEARS